MKTKSKVLWLPMRMYIGLANAECEERDLPPMTSGTDKEVDFWEKTLFNAYCELKGETPPRNSQGQFLYAYDTKHVVWGVAEQYHRWKCKLAEEEAALEPVIS